MYRIVCDYRTNRLIYFSDQKDNLVVDHANQYQIDYTGKLPDGLTLTNVWDYRFNRMSKQIEFAGEVNKPDNALEENRKALINLLERIFIAKRKPFEPSSFLVSVIRECKYRDAIQNENTGVVGPFLQQVMTARGLSATEARHLIVHKYQTTQKVLLATELQRESLKFEIENAATEENLAKLHDQIYLLQ